METKDNINISIRELIEFIFRNGDLDKRFQSNSRAVKGSKIHKNIQDNMKKKLDYKSEIVLKYTHHFKDITINITGIADGSFKKNDSFVIDEIKTTKLSLENINEDIYKNHWAQAKCYAYIFANNYNLPEMNIQLTYFNIKSENIKRLKRKFSFEDLKKFFLNLLDKYIEWIQLELNWQKARDISIEKTDFPYPEYRKGQRKLAVSVYKTINKSKNLFVQAPTGIGKTISTIFPALKAMGKGLTTKIFYLTAKNITRQVAEENITEMRKNGLKLKSVTITAKDKICFMDNTNCHPKYCKYAHGHYNRVNQALKDILNNEDKMTRNIIEKYAKEYKVCPFEFSLDITLWADLIICDYNYVFDPQVYLKRFFLNDSGEYTFLVDESHNLVDRARNMFSAKLTQEEIINVKNKLLNNPKLKNILLKINDLLSQLGKKITATSNYIFIDENIKLYSLLEKFKDIAEKWLTINNEKRKGYTSLLDFYFDIRAFLQIKELYNENYKIYMKKENDKYIYKLFCFDPSSLLKDTLERCRSAIFFSATLTPLPYFQNLLGGNKQDYFLNLITPFNEENLSLFIADNISTKYHQRNISFNKIVSLIKNMISAKKGNYLIFFPSYKYMNDVAEIFKKDYPQIDTIIQTRSMNESDRQNYLTKFIENDKTESILGFAVLGGVFSEGIDLKGDNLLGTIVVGVGHPRLSLERNIIKDHFQKQNGLGYEYAYIYPGMNKVMQAAGRTIRSQKDKGVILLIAKRFTEYRYKKLFPAYWKKYKKIYSAEDFQSQLIKFWD